MDLPRFWQKNWTESTLFPCQKWTCLDFGSTFFPCQKWTRLQRNWTGSTFFPCQEWTCLDFGSETGPGPLFSPAKNGPAWISAAKLDRVHFFPLPRMDLPGFWQRNWTGSTFFSTKLDQVYFWQGRSTFGRKKWTPRSIFFCQNWTGGPLFSRSTFGMTDHCSKRYGSKGWNEGWK